MRALSSYLRFIHKLKQGAEQTDTGRTKQTRGHHAKTDEIYERTLLT